MGVPSSSQRSSRSTPATDRRPDASMTALSGSNCEGNGPPPASGLASEVGSGSGSIQYGRRPEPTLTTAPTRTPSARAVSIGCVTFTPGPPNRTNVRGTERLRTGPLADRKIIGIPRIVVYDQCSADRHRTIVGQSPSRLSSLLAVASSPCLGSQALVAQGIEHRPPEPGA